MDLLHKAEKTMEGFFKSAPKLSDDTRETIAKVWPWIALVGGILQLLSAWWLLNWARSANSFVDYADRLSRALGGDGVAASRWTFWIWVSLAFMVAQAVLLLVAFPKLQRREKSGWDLLFLSALVGILSSVVSYFVEYRGGFGSLVFGVLLMLIGLWLLFETRSKFKGVGLDDGKKPAARKPAEK